MVNYEEMAKWHARQRGGRLHKRADGKLLFVPLYESDQTESYDNYKDYLKKFKNF